MNTCLNFTVWLINTGSVVITKICNSAKDIYLVLTVTPELIIGPSGQIFSTTMFDIVDSSQMWHYKNNCLYRSSNSDYKRINILSCEFMYNGQTVTMDDFLENTKFVTEGLTFPIFMAAFTIYSKKIYPWEDAEFSVFTRNGNSAQFIGSNIKYIKDIGITVSEEVIQTKI